MNPRVKKVVANDDYTLKITFTSGEVGIFGCSDLLSFGVFRELRDLCYFKQAHVQNGTVVWPHEQDICPDTLYEDSRKVGKMKRRTAAVKPRNRARSLVPARH
jgi:hypothetical protein